MLVRIKSAANLGIKAIGIDVEVNISNKGLPTFEIVGLPSKTVAESKERVRTAIMNSGLEFPNKRIVINLAPADVQKEGSYFDLPIAIGILSACYGFVIPDTHLFYGELSLDGSLRHSHGAFLVSIYAKENNIDSIFVPDLCKSEAAAVFSKSVFGIMSLKELFLYLTNSLTLLPYKNKALPFVQTKNHTDISEIIGQEQAKRALEISLAGGHNMFLSGPPGVGKSMLAKAIPSLLPDLTFEESIELTKVHSAADLILPNSGLVNSRQCRTPHHTISYAGLIGGGAFPRPGEISLAHRGVLFLDEFPEFSRQALESLRQPLEDGEINITRSNITVTYPCKFILIGCANPCPCGYFGSSTHGCTCTQYQIGLYNKKLSGPILDRIDIFSRVGNVNDIDMQSYNEKIAQAEKSGVVRKRIMAARNIQKTRMHREGVLTNAEMSNAQIDRYCTLAADAAELLKKSTKVLKLSPRSYFKILKVARTIADLSTSDTIEYSHLAEAIQYKSTSS